MTFSQVYATTLLPGLLAWTILRLTAYFGVDDILAWGATLVIFLPSAYLGYEVEHHYFREVCEGKGKLTRLFVFMLGLPAIYLVSLIVAVAIHFCLPELSFPAMLSLSILAAGLWLLLRDYHHRGRRLFTERYIARIAQADLPEGDEGIPLGTIPIPTEKACTHLCFVGTTGSGKTTAIRRIIAAILRSIGTATLSIRALVYDPKTEFFGWLSATAPCPVHTFHPFDRRGKAWNMCKDIRDPKAAGQFAFTFVPQEDGNNRFFSDAGRAILNGVLNSFILNSPDDWTFRHLLLACETKDRLTAVLERDELTKNTIAQYLQIGEVAATNVLATLNTRLNPFRPIAACWAKAEPLSLTDWVNGEFILLLPQDETARAPLALLNGLIFEFLTQQLLGYQTNEQLKAQGLRLRRSFLFLDELRDIADTLNKPLTSILTRGRAWGIACITGWQSQSGLIDATNQNRGPEVFGMHSYIGMLRVQEKETAGHLSTLCGDREIYRQSADGKRNLVTEPVVMPTAFSELGTNPIEAYFLAPPPLGLWKGMVPFPEGQPKHENAPADFLPRDVADQYLAPWTKADLERLKLPLSQLDVQKPPDNQRQTARIIPNGTRGASGLQVVDLRNKGDSTSK